MNKKQTINLDNLNVWANCKIQFINEETNKFQTVCEVPYTPKHVKIAMKKHNMKSAWIWFMGERTYQFVDEIVCR